MFTNSFESESVLSKKVTNHLDYFPCQININVVFILNFHLYSNLIPHRKYLSTLISSRMLQL